MAKKRQVFLTPEDEQIVDRDQLKHAIIIEARNEAKLGEIGEPTIHWGYMDRPRRAPARPNPGMSPEAIKSLSQWFAEGGGK